MNTPPSITGGLDAEGDQDTSFGSTATAVDPDGQTLTWSVATQPDNGSATIDPATGAWVYTPDPGFVGADSFTITVTDGIDSDTATVDVTSDPVLAISLNVHAECVADTPYVHWDVSVSDGFDASTMTATIEWVDSTGVVRGTLIDQPLNGSALWHGAAVDGNGDPVAWPGWELVNDTWVSFDDSLRYGMQLRVTVNPEATAAVTYPPATTGCSAEPPMPPVADDETVTIDQDTTAGGHVTFNDPSTADTHNFTVHADPISGTVDVDPATGEWVYTPDPGFYGQDHFEIRVTDRTGLFSDAMITVNVTPAPTSVVARAFFDWNGDGIRQGGEPWIAAVYTLYPAGGDPSDATSTGSVLSAVWDDIAHGDWVIRVSAPGFTTVEYTFTVDETTGEIHVAVTGTATATGVVGWDTTGDGHVDRPAANTTLTATYEYGDGQQLTITFTTDDNGG